MIEADTTGSSLLYVKLIILLSLAFKDVFILSKLKTVNHFSQLLKYSFSLVWEQLLMLFVGIVPRGICGLHSKI